MSKKIDETHYNQIVDNFIETLRQRKFHLWNLALQFEKDGNNSFSDMIDEEIAQIDKVFKLYKNNKF